MALVCPSDLSAAAAGPTQCNLSWSNPAAYEGIEVHRSPDGSAWTTIATLTGDAISYADTACQDGTLQYYRLEASTEAENGYSNTATTTTPLAAPSGLGGSGTHTTVDLAWVDNCQNESGFKIYKDGVLEATVGPNVTTYQVTGLTGANWYEFYVTAYNALVTSPLSNVIIVYTEDPPNKPDEVTATTTGTTTATVNWKDNSANETLFSIEQSSTSASAGFAEIATVGPDIDIYAVTGLTSNTQYWFKVRAYNASGYSDYSNVATCVTFAAIAAPTNLIVTPISDTVIDIYFDDNSSLEDDHRLERKTGAGAYSEIATLPPNFTAYRDTGLTAGTLYTYRVRAKQGASYSSYCAEVAGTTYDTLGAPTGLAVAEYQDTWVKLSWTALTGASGYRIQTSADDITYATYATIYDEITSFKVTGLSASTLRYFKIAAMNPAGVGTYTAAVSQTTRAAYNWSALQRFIRRVNAKLIYLVEMNPLYKLAGWSLTSGKTYTYQAIFNERGAEIDAVYENGTALDNYKTVAGVEANAGSWFHDVANGLIYVHPSGEDTPNNYTLTASFWLYFSTYQEAGAGIVFNEHYYMPLVPSDGIPDVTQEIQRFFASDFVITSGSISLVNGELKTGYFFDAKFNEYLWLNRKCKILAGAPGFTYSQYQAIATGIVTAYTCTDQRIVFDLRDRRDGIHKTLPVDRFTVNEFPRLSSDAVDRARAFGYGTITNAVPPCIDTTNRIFEFCAGRIKSVEAVTQNGVALSAGTDYGIDYQRGRITLGRDLVYSSDDKILVNFTGHVDAGDNALATAAEIFKHIMNNHLDVANADLDLDSIWATHLAVTTALSVYVWKEQDSQELIRRLEQSVQADTFQTVDGLVGLKQRLTSAPTDIFYVPDCLVRDFSMSRDDSTLFSQVTVFYLENPAEDKFSSVTVRNKSVKWQHGVAKTLEIYTGLKTQALANTLGAAIVAMMDKKDIEFSTDSTLFTCLPGDLIYFSRTRYYSLALQVANKLLRILSISKSHVNGTTIVKCEEV